MDAFHQSLQNWQVFYSTVAAASATLSGLLFVSLSLNRERLRGKNATMVIDNARRTFSDFLYILMISVTFLVPHRAPLSLTIALLVLGISRGFGLVREAAAHIRKSNRKISTPVALRAISLPFLASIGLILIALAISAGANDALFGLVAVIAALLITACWNAWLLLIEE